VLPAIALVAGLAAGALFLARAQGEPRWAFQICHALGSDTINESRYLAKNGAAMTKMMSDMAMEPTGDVDADFVAVMTPHYRGAIEMANRRARGLGKPETFDFLGFKHHCATRRDGSGFVLGRKPMAKRMRTKLREVMEQLMATRHDGVDGQGKWLAKSCGAGWPTILCR
jgi:Domain of unknown function (DUF305)